MMDTINFHKLTLTIDNLYDDGEWIWFTSSNYNALFRMDYNSLEPEYMGSFPNINCLCKDMFSDIIGVDDKLYFCPKSSKVDIIGIYNKKTGEFSGVDWTKLNLKSISPSEKNMFSSMYFYNDHVYCFPYNKRGILDLDINTLSVSVITECFEFIDEKLKPMFNRVYGCGNIVYAPLSCTNQAIKINLDTKQYEVIEIGSPSSSFSDVKKIGDIFVSLPYKGNEIVFFSKESKVIYEIGDLAEIKSAKSCVNNNEIIVIPYYTDNFYIVRPFEKKQDAIVQPLKLVKHNCNVINKIIYGYAGIVRNYLWIFDNLSKELLCFDSNYKLCFRKTIKLEGENSYKLKKQLHEEIGLSVIEEMDMCLEDFLSII